MQRFVFLEFTDQRLRMFLEDLRDALQDQPAAKLPIHITIRGPYSDEPKSSLIQDLEESLQGYGVVIGGAGTFKTKEGYAVYLRAQSPVFQELWWKPDFPEVKPHLTIFETTKKKAARMVEVFLRSERIQIFTFALKVRVYTSRQRDLFENFPSDKSRFSKFGPPTAKWHIKPGLIERARKLRNESGIKS